MPNRPFLVFDFRALGHSGARLWAPECPKVINYNGGLASLASNLTVPILNSGQNVLNLPVCVCVGVCVWYSDRSRTRLWQSWFPERLGPREHERRLRLLPGLRAEAGEPRALHRRRSHHFHRQRARPRLHVSTSASTDGRRFARKKERKHFEIDSAQPPRRSCWEGRPRRVWAENFLTLTSTSGWGHPSVGRSEKVEVKAKICIALNYENSSVKALRYGTC